MWQGFFMILIMNFLRIVLFYIISTIVMITQLMLMLRKFSLYKLLRIGKALSKELYLVSIYNDYIHPSLKQYIPLGRTEHQKYPNVSRACNW